MSKDSKFKVISEEEAVAHTEKVYRAGTNYGFLVKRSFRLTEYVYSPELNGQVEAVGGRVAHHLRRLLDPERSDPENQFALAFIAFGAPILARLQENPSKRSEYRKIREVIGIEGYDTCLWWTLAPYIFEQLSKIDEKPKAIQKILDWAKTGEVNAQGVHLKGLDIYNIYGGVTFILNKDPNHYSHQLAREEATRLVSEVFS
jgi:hypothetical protein